MVNSPVYSPHPNYHIIGGDLNLIVGNFRFRIHSHFFVRESSVWSDILLSSFMKDPKAPGHREKDPITLDVDISSQDFADLLWVFYNEHYGIYEADLDKWLSILSLATKWQFAQVQRFAIDHLELIPGIDSVDKIKLYTDRHVPQAYIAPHYMHLACCPQPLSSKAFHMLPPDTMYRIVRAREILRAPPQEDVEVSLNPIRGGLTDTNIRDTIFSVFDIPGAIN